MFVLSDEAAGKRDKFLGLLFGKAKGFVCIARRKPGTRKLFEEFFTWPDERLGIAQFVRRFYDWELYYSPMLYEERRRGKETVITTPCAWADLDGCDPMNMLVVPSFEIESSPGRFQALWVFAENVEPPIAEDISRRIAYAHIEQGADKSGWDLTQLLRLPFTSNFKYGNGVEAPVVKIIKARPDKYTVKDFVEYPEVEGFEYTQVSFPEESELPSAEEVLQEHRHDVHPHVWHLYSNTPLIGAKDGWSKPLWNLEILLFESGLTRYEVFAVARNAACNKYRRDGRSEVLLWREVCRAERVLEDKNRAQGPIHRDLPALLTEGERTFCEQTPSIVDEYVEWAKTTGDAAWQYHQVGAFVVLSSLLAGAVRLPTSFGPIIPNLWFMILADTTLTRKTTAMDLAVDLLTEIDSDVILATDGSIEGLFTSLSMRPGRPSIFLRDEFSGMLEMMNRKEYYAGMSETLTKMYDGKFQKRVLRREVIEVREPVLIFFAGGIKERVGSILQFEQVSSGFIPRFVIVMAESDVTSLKPLGPPSQTNLERRGQLLQKLTTMWTAFARTATVTANGQAVVSKKYSEAKLTPEAWSRYNQLEATMLASGLDSAQADLLTPCMDRLSKSGLKASVLLAAADSKENVLVEEHHVVRAFYYIEQWRQHTVDLIKGIGTTTDERRIAKILEAISREPGILRSTLMVRFHLSKREADHVFDTLDQRGLITRMKSGKTERLAPIGG